MHEIRFSSPVKKDEAVETHVSLEENKNKSKGRKFTKTIFAIFVALIVIIGFVYLKDFVPSFFSSGQNDSWSAVFLSNGQVYFGKIDSNNSKEMVLKDVYYLQAEENTLPGQANDLNQSRFKLVKLGSELHGPKDILLINKNSVIFYEYLRDDSKVVESIKNFK